MTDEDDVFITTTRMNSVGSYRTYHTDEECGLLPEPENQKRISQQMIDHHDMNHCKECRGERESDGGSKDHLRMIAEHVKEERDEDLFEGDVRPSVE